MMDLDKKLVMALVAAAFASCSREPRILPAVVVDVRDKAAPAPVATPAQAQAAKPAPPRHPTICEVEIHEGIVRLRKGTKAPGRIDVVVTEGDCLSKDARFLGHTEATAAGKFYLEIFPSWGGDLSICAQVATAQGKPARVYGKAPKTYHAEQPGEIVLNDVVVELSEGPPHVFPTAAASAPATPAIPLRP